MEDSLQMKNKEYWRAVQNHDKSFDGKFYYGVKSTSVFCKPSCPSRRPSREQVTFFATAAEALAEGFRPCKRCKPDVNTQKGESQRVFELAKEILDGETGFEFSVSIWAEKTGVSQSILRSAIKEETGLSPREYLINNKISSFKDQIKSGEALTTAIYSAGFGSSSRLYEKAGESLGMTPGNYKKGGQGELINYSIMTTPFGNLMLAYTAKGLCSVKFGKSEIELFQILWAEFPQAEIVATDSYGSQWEAALQDYFSGVPISKNLPIDIHDTVFRQKVWDALREIPYGETRSYSEVAESIGQPTAVRAVASACAANPIAIVTPCHRVIHSDGSISGYRWGTKIKEGLLEVEKKMKMDPARSTGKSA